VKKKKRRMEPLRGKMETPGRENCFARKKKGGGSSLGERSPSNSQTVGNIRDLGGGGKGEKRLVL